MSLDEFAADYAMVEGYRRAYAEFLARTISADTLRDYEIMRANMRAQMRGASPAERLRAVLRLQNAERVRATYQGVRA